MVRFFSPTADEVAAYHGKNLKGTTAIVTGSSTGIGKEVARVFCKLGARVIMANRTLSKAEDAATDIRKALENEPNIGTVEVMKLDLMDFDSVKSFSDAFHALDIPLHYLIGNAGIMFTPLWYTKQGYEAQFGTNHLGHYLLVRLLTDCMKKAGEARLVLTTSSGHHFATDWDWPSEGRKGFRSDEGEPYEKVRVYGNSKLANILTAKEFSEQMKKEGFPNIVGYSAHPGGVKTELGRDLTTAMAVLLKIISIGFKTPNQGSATIMESSLSDEMLQSPGAYVFPGLKWPYPCNPSKMGQNKDDQKRLWAESEKIVSKWL